MLLSNIQLLALIGVVMLLVAYTTNEDMLAILTSLVGTFAWGLAAYGLFDIEIEGAASNYSEPSTALFAVALALVTLLPALVDPFEIIGDASETDDPLDKL